MILRIDTTNNGFLEIALEKTGEIKRTRTKAHYNQAEKLLPAIEAVLKKNKVELKDVKKIKVRNRGGSFTSLRIGVVTANALAYALGIRIEGENGSKKIKGIEIVEPIYGKEPNITIKRIT